MSTLSDSFMLPVLAWLSAACIIWLLSRIFAYAENYKTQQRPESSRLRVNSKPLKRTPMMTLVLLVAGAACFGLFFKAVDFFENV